MTIRFTKMHGAGNDYIYLDGFHDPMPSDPAELARRMSHRRFGIGADGLILILPSQVADARMQMYNADGSEAEMCGNGIRCVAKFVFDHGICAKEQLRIETKAGVLLLDLDVADGRVARVTVDMGEPILEPSKIPTTLPGNPVVNMPLAVGGHTFDVTSVSLGNPHCVIFVDELDDQLVNHFGPLIEKDAHFPARVNVEFVRVVSPTEVVQRTWERGSGETWACGTGATAVCVAGVLTGRTERAIENHLLGGDLHLHWKEEDNHVYMTGPAVEVFRGEWPDE